MPDGEVAALDERDAVAARRGVERDAGAGDAAADHDQVEGVALEGGERVGARDHGRNVTYSPGGSPLGRLLRPGAAGRGGSARARARPSGTPTAARPSGVRRTAGRAPVAGEPARVRARAARCTIAHGRRAQVLLVLDRVAVERDLARHHERRRAVELRRRLRAGRLLQPRERLAGRARGSATGSSGCGWAPSAPARAAPRALARSPARRRRPCACAACGSRPPAPPARR